MLRQRSFRPRQDSKQGRRKSLLAWHVYRYQGFHCWMWQMSNDQPQVEEDRAFFVSNSSSIWSMETSKLVETSASLNWCFKPLFNVLQIKKFVKYQTNPKKSYPKSRREAGQLGWAYRRHFISISYVSQNHIFVFVVICRIINVLNSLKTKNLWRAISLELIGGWGRNP